MFQRRTSSIFKVVLRVPQIRRYRVLAIETSCDDTCVTLLDRHTVTAPPSVVDERKLTLNSVEAGGVVPKDAALHNRKSVSVLVKEVIEDHGWIGNNRPDLICCTRGPGMIGSLVGGYQLAIGLSIAWNVPLVGVNHMLGHLLVPRLATNGEEPKFPFLSLLVSGGHTMCVLSTGLMDHEILVNTIDIAAGDALDKCGREIGISGNMIGKEMEKFLIENKEQWGKFVEFDIKEPMQNNGERKNVLAYSFASFISQLKSSLGKYHNGEVQNEENKARIAYIIQTTIFQHMITKIKLAIKLKNLKVDSFVCSGGVGSNLQLREMLKEQLTPLGVEKFYFPEPRLCTDNATMIGWAGIELFEQGYTTNLGTSVIRKWPLDEILELDGWIKR
ncbi:hypothetical protein CANARDRAFT_29162 [[Candida] arabinofermentans NRRL YB-2248]|uniref:N(6)-L-threonylcarbamoyladenine synthase n=1 Tax=[Candida] arabinofermentans NRRL YB-2248 TaxID=983967 RepID=A0A1E4SYQ7_9ASCO|nr:hypothetical protein CANARDRAFT_29162 [[Candida] arabinofermentans NRRL YB-2248]